MTTSISTSTVRRSRGRSLIAVVIAAALGTLLLGWSSPASAEADGTLQTGVLTLYSGPNYTGSSMTAQYDDCPDVTPPVLRTVGSFKHQALPGCQPILATAAGEYPFCNGSVPMVPSQYQVGTLGFRPGFPQICFIG